jgi:hypothetical protein
MTNSSERGFPELAADLASVRARIEARLMQNQCEVEQWQQENSWLLHNTPTLKEWINAIVRHPRPSQHQQTPQPVAEFPREARRKIRDELQFKYLERECARISAKLFRRRFGDLLVWIVLVVMMIGVFAAVLWLVLTRMPLR